MKFIRYSFLSWSPLDKKTFSVFLIIGVSIFFVGFGINSYIRFHSQKIMLTEVRDISNIGLSLARFEIGQGFERWRLCFVEANPNTLRYISEQLSQADTKRPPDHTLINMEMKITLVTLKGEQRQFVAKVYSKAPDEVFLWTDPHAEELTSRRKKEAFPVRIPRLSRWIGNKFREYGCEY